MQGNLASHRDLPLPSASSLSRKYCPHPSGPYLAHADRDTFAHEEIQYSICPEVPWASKTTYDAGMPDLWLVGHLHSRMTMMSLNTVVEDNVPKWSTPGRSQCSLFFPARLEDSWHTVTWVIPGLPCRTSKVTQYLSDNSVAPGQWHLSPGQTSRIPGSISKELCVMVGIGCQLDRLWNRHGDKPLGMSRSTYLEWLLEVGKPTLHMVSIFPWTAVLG